MARQTALVGLVAVEVRGTCNETLLGRGKQEAASGTVQAIGRTVSITVQTSGVAVHATV